MALINTLTKALGWIFASLIVGLVMFYLLLLAINWQDEAPGAAALQLKAVQKTYTDNKTTDNGYVVFSQHASSVEHQVAPALQQLIQQCYQARCEAVLNNAASQLPELIAQHQLLLKFYQQIRSYSHWYEPPITDVLQEIPPYQVLRNAQQLLLFQAWLAAHEQDVIRARQLLQQDLAFWRTVLPNNNSLLSKMLTVAAVKKHFAFAELIQQQLEPSLQAAVIPAIWSQPFTDNELDMQQAFSGEWVFVSTQMQQSMQQPSDKNMPVLEKLGLMLFRPLVLLQATNNENAERLLRIANGGVVPEQPWFSWLYNPVGKILNSTGSEAYSEYARQVSELELLRQQALSPYVLAANGV
jgi:hypothetical protein